MPTLFAVAVEIFDRFFGGSGARAHQHKDAVGIGTADIIEQVIGATGPEGEAVHRILNDRRARAIKWVDRLARLEEDVRVLRGAAKQRTLRSQPAIAMLSDEFFIDECAKVIILEHIDLVQFVRGAESIEEMQERNPRFERRGLRDESEIAGFLHGVGRQQRESSRSRGHDVAVIAKNGKGVRRDRACRDVDHARV